MRRNSEEVSDSIFWQFQYFVFLIYCNLDIVPFWQRKPAPFYLFRGVQSPSAGVFMHSLGMYLQKVVCIIKSLCLWVWMSSSLIEMEKLELPADNSEKYILV